MELPKEISGMIENAPTAVKTAFKRC